MAPSNTSYPDRTDLENYLYEHIPITREIDLSVQVSSREEVVLTAPLEPNVNHQNTVFGGSASAVSMLAGWGLVFQYFHDWEAPTRIVIQRSTIEFEEPLRSQFTAHCKSPGQESWSELQSNLKRWGKARIELDVQLIVAEERVGFFEGTYAIVEEAESEL